MKGIWHPFLCFPSLYSLQLRFTSVSNIVSLFPSIPIPMQVSLLPSSRFLFLLSLCQSHFAPSFPGKRCDASWHPFPIPCRDVKWRSRTCRTLYVTPFFSVVFSPFPVGRYPLTYSRVGFRNQFQLSWTFLSLTAHPQVSEMLTFITRLRVIPRSPNFQEWHCSKKASH